MRSCIEKRWFLLLVFIICFGFAGALCAASPHPLELNENQPYGRLTNDYVTPHVEWANPYARGKVKVLVLAPEWSQRETVELAQRLSLDYTAWMSYSFNKITETSADPAFAFFCPPASLTHSLLADCLQKNYDAFVIGKLDWMMLPSKQRFILLEKVSNGAGLVYVNPPGMNKELDIVFGGKADPAGADFILRNLPAGALMHFKDIKSDALVKTVQFG